MKDKKQPKRINRNQLYQKGWTISQAARAIGRTPVHVAAVIDGKRTSEKLLEQLVLLPDRPLQSRREDERAG